MEGVELVQAVGLGEDFRHPSPLPASPLPVSPQQVGDLGLVETVGLEKSRRHQWCNHHCSEEMISSIA